MLNLAYDNIAQRGDLTRSTGRNLDTDAGLETAVTLSLFSDARALESDDLDPNADQRGWWGEAYLDDQRQYGSRLWLLRRAKMTIGALQECTGYALEALQWLVDDGISAANTANTVFAPGKPQSSGIVLLTVGIERPARLSPRFAKTWEVQLGL